MILLVESLGLQETTTNPPTPLLAPLWPALALCPHVEKGGAPHPGQQLGCGPSWSSALCILQGRGSCSVIFVPTGRGFVASEQHGEKPSVPPHTPRSPTAPSLPLRSALEEANEASVCAGESAAPAAGNEAGALCASLGAGRAG